MRLHIKIVRAHYWFKTMIWLVLIEKAWITWNYTPALYIQCGICGKSTIKSFNQLRIKHNWQVGRWDRMESKSWDPTLFDGLTRSVHPPLEQPAVSLGQGYTVWQNGIDARMQIKHYLMDWTGHLTTGWSEGLGGQRPGHNHNVLCALDHNWNANACTRLSWSAMHILKCTRHTKHMIECNFTWNPHTMIQVNVKHTVTS